MNLPASVIGDDGSWQRPARLVDLGLGGASVALQEPVAAGSHLTLVIDAPHLWDPLEITGLVVWSRTDLAPSVAVTPTILGVAFDRPAAVTLRRVAELLAANLF